MAPFEVFISLQLLRYDLFRSVKIQNFVEIYQCFMGYARAMFYVDHRFIQ